VRFMLYSSFLLHVPWNYPSACVAHRERGHLFNTATVKDVLSMVTTPVARLSMQQPLPRALSRRTATNGGRGPMTDTNAV
jgi:hypothetical protein